MNEVIEVSKAPSELTRRRLHVEPMAVAREMDTNRPPVQRDTLGGGPQVGFRRHASSFYAVEENQYRR